MSFPGAVGIVRFFRRFAIKTYNAFDFLKTLLLSQTNMCVKCFLFHLHYLVQFLKTNEMNLSD